MGRFRLARFAKDWRNVSNGGLGLWVLIPTRMPDSLSKRFNEKLPRGMRYRFLLHRKHPVIPRFLVWFQRVSFMLFDFKKLIVMKKSTLSARMYAHYCEPWSVYHFYFNCIHLCNSHFAKKPLAPAKFWKGFQQKYSERLFRCSAYKFCQYPLILQVSLGKYFVLTWALWF